MGVAYRLRLSLPGQPPLYLLGCQLILILPVSAALAGVPSVAVTLKVNVPVAVPVMDRGGTPDRVRPRG
jgi:hypothetical protein